MKRILPLIFTIIAILFIASSLFIVFKADYEPVGEYSVNVLFFSGVAIISILIIYFNIQYSRKRTKSSEASELKSNFNINIPKSIVTNIRLVTFILLLLLLFYPSFFIEKSYFSTSLTSNINKLNMDRLNVELEIKTIQANESEVNEEKIKSPIFLRKPENIEDKKRKLSIYNLEIKNLEDKLINLKSENHYINLYLIIRALALGAIGAMLTMITHSSTLPTSHQDSLFQSENFLSKLIRDSVIGSIISVIVFALFYTKQITIFNPNDSQQTTTPDYWRITLLCIVAGAFSEKIYNAVSSKIDNYIPKEEKDHHSV